MSEENTEPEYQPVSLGHDFNHFIHVGQIYQTPKTDILDEALAKAQGEIHIALKTSANPFFKSKYADLGSVIEASREALAKYGIAVMQWTFDGPEKNRAYMYTRVACKGQWIMTSSSIPMSKADAQGQVAAYTYLRRAMYSAAVGVATGDDDDGNTVSGNNSFGNHNDDYNEVKPRYEKPKEPPKPLFNMPTKPTPPLPNHAPSKAATTPDKSPVAKPPLPDQKEKPQHPSVDQIRKLFSVASEKDIGPDKLKQILEMGMGIEATTQMSQQQWQSLVDLLQSGYNNVESIIKELKK